MRDKEIFKIIQMIFLRVYYLIIKFNNKKMMKARVKLKFLTKKIIFYKNKIWFQLVLIKN